MSRVVTVVLAVTVGVLVGIPLGGRVMGGRQIPDDESPVAAAFAAVPGGVGEEDVAGPYTPVEGWPQDISTLPGNEKWTYGAAQGIFGESPDRVYLLARGELPNLKEPETTKLTQLGPSLQFPVGGLPWRSATATALPGSGGTGQDPEKGMENWRGSKPPYRVVGVDALWEHCFTVVDGQGKIIRQRPSSLHLIQIGTDGMLWTFDRNTQKMLKYDLEGHLQYSWGAVGDFPGMLWGVHGMSVDQQGNLYTASVDSGLFQKFVPRQGANPAYLMAGRVYSAWQ